MLPLDRPLVNEHPNHPLVFRFGADPMPRETLLIDDIAENPTVLGMPPWHGHQP